MKDNELMVEIALLRGEIGALRAKLDTLIQVLLAKDTMEQWKPRPWVDTKDPTT